MKTSIFFGNGLNRAAHSSISWDQLLLTIMQGKIFKSTALPNTLAYERIYLDRDDAAGEQSIKSEIASLLRETSSNELYDEIINLGCSDFLTTNYDYAFEASVKIKPNMRNTEEIYSLRRFREYPHPENPMRLWSLHGEIDYPKTIMLGLDHYCGAIAKLDSYVKGKYITQRNGVSYTVEKMIDKLHKKSFCHTSWVDLFFSSDIHIVGLSLDFSETDLWWILNKRARLSREAPVRNNIYFHSTDEKDNKIDLLKSFGVSVINHSTSDGYMKAYHEIFDMIRQRKYGPDRKMIV